MSDWIKCSDRMPELSQQVLCVDSDGEYEVALYAKGCIQEFLSFPHVAASFLLHTGSHCPHHQKTKPPFGGFFMHQ